jgi:hypothetical protein
MMGLLRKLLVLSTLPAQLALIAAGDATMVGVILAVNFCALIALAGSVFLKPAGERFHERER